MAERCQCCGQFQPEPDDIVIDEDRLEIRRGGKYVTLTDTETRLMKSLAERLGSAKSRDTILVDMYWDRDEMPQGGIIQVLVHRLRRKIKPLNLEISARRGPCNSGYRLQATR